MKYYLLESLRNFSNFIFDLIFPIYCVSCGKEGKWICEKCKSQIIMIKNPVCPFCRKLSANGKVCRQCRKKSSLSGLIVAAYYREGVLREAIHNFKYSGVYTLQNELGDLLCRQLKNWSRKAVLIPVPIHKRKERERGYNQSFLLSKKIGEKLKFSVIKNKLIKIKITKNQIELSGKERINNVKNAFKWVGEKEIFGKTVLLVDDVYTTGSTLEECAKILKNSGASEVWAAVLAKA